MTAPSPSSNLIFYCGQSMRGTLRDGDMLRLEEIPFHQLRRGDVVVFFSKNPPLKKGPRSKNTSESALTEQYVHRIIKIKRNEYLVTQGDNNPHPDPIVYPEQNPRRVVQILRNERFIPMPSGYWGLLRFYFLQIRRNLRQKMAFFLRPLFHLAPFFFLRSFFSPLEFAHFADQDVLYQKKRPFAVRKWDTSDWLILSPTHRLIYSVSFLNRHYPPSSAAYRKNP